MNQLKIMNFWIQILYNILGGIIVVTLVEGWHKLMSFLNGRKFRHIFGFNSEDTFYICYGSLELDPSKLDNTRKLNNFVFYKPGVPGNFGNLSSLVSSAETRGIKYLAESFGRNSSIKPSLVSDIEVEKKLDISYCAIGGRNNLKTNYIEEYEENTFFKFDFNTGESIVDKSNPQIKFSISIDTEYDYGFIIKLRPKSLINRSWIAIAGLGEDGTSGAAWFLARNWKNIEKLYSEKPFGLIIKVKKGKDESAQMVYRLPQ